MGWWVADFLRDSPALLVSWIVWVIGSIVLHELAHGWAAIKLGDDTPTRTGHMTWNPLIHMGGMSLIVFAIIGIAWGQMPVNPARLRGRYGESLVALAGPAMNIALALVAIILAAVWGGYAQSIPDPLWQNLLLFFKAGAFLNVSLAVFNLLPVPPLDGSRILAGVSTSYRRLMDHPNAPIISMILLVILMSRGSRYITGPVAEASGDAIQAVQSVLPGAEKTVLLNRESDFDRGESPPPSPAP